MWIFIIPDQFGAAEISKWKKIHGFVVLFLALACISTTILLFIVLYLIFPHHKSYLASTLPAEFPYRAVVILGLSCLESACAVSYWGTMITEVALNMNYIFTSKVVLRLLT